MAKQLGFDFFEVEPEKQDNVRTKKCKTCGVEKPETKEYYHAAAKSHVSDNQWWHSSCIECRNKSDAVKYHLHKTAPPMPDHCECCGSHKEKYRGEKLHLDHDWDTHKFRGWLCGACNRGIGNLGDDIEGVLKALAYLKRHYEKD